MAALTHQENTMYAKKSMLSEALPPSPLPERSGNISSVPFAKSCGGRSHPSNQERHPSVRAK